MSHVFISYAEEDAALVTDLVTELEDRGHNCWYYERNTNAGTSYLQQISQALSASSVFLLVISQHSLNSRQVTKEVEQAHEHDLHILPLLSGVTTLEMRRKQPSWSAALGTTTCLNLQRLDWNALVSEMVRSLELLERQTGGGEENETAQKARPSTLWISDGSQIDIPFLEDVLFQTPIIKSFLESDHQFFVSANKGLGKTLLLRYKRSLLMDEYTRSRKEGLHPAVHFVPEGRPYLDFMSSAIPSLSKGHLKFLTSLRNCKRLWSLAIRASAISHFPDIVGGLGEQPEQGVARHVLNWLAHPRVQPTTVFKDLLALSVRELNQLLDSCENRLDYLFRGVHSGVYFFIDKVEQGISNLGRDAWINVQAGLLEAAWDIMNANNHVKVFATIREEAYANYESDIKANLFSATAMLRYGLDDLHDMIDGLCEFYESQPKFADFVKLRTVRNTHCRVDEDSFRYLHRHAVGRPRDLVIICSELSKRRSELTERQFREVVNEVSSNHVVANVFDEMAVFLDCLRSREDRQQFFGLLPYNILTPDELMDICCRFNGLAGMSIDDLQSADELLRHPFCELYSCGLLGVVRANSHDEAPQQLFKQPHDIMNYAGSCLPPAEFYLVHPSLQSLIHRQGSGHAYRTFRYIAVGHKYPWRSHFPALVAVQRALGKLSQNEVVESVTEVVEQLANEATRGTADLMAVAGAVKKSVEQSGHDELYFALDELVDRVRARLAEGDE